MERCYQDFRRGQYSILQRVRHKGNNARQAATYAKRVPARQLTSIAMSLGPRQ